jgi:hypothetical protein
VCAKFDRASKFAQIQLSEYGAALFRRRKLFAFICLGDWRTIRHLKIYLTSFHLVLPFVADGAAPCRNTGTKLGLLGEYLSWKNKKSNGRMVATGPLP